MVRGWLLVRGNGGLVGGGGGGLGGVKLVGLSSICCVAPPVVLLLGQVPVVELELVVGTGVGRREVRCGSCGLSSDGSSLLFLHSDL